MRFMRRRARDFGVLTPPPSRTTLGNRQAPEGQVFWARRLRKAESENRQQIQIPPGNDLIDRHPHVEGLCQQDHFPHE